MPSSASTNMVVAPKSVTPPPAQPETQITAPSLPISADKQAALQQLLSQYEANQITAGQYQAQRAKILAQP
jgi:hypothetical protein